MLSRVSRDELPGGSGSGAERTVLFEGRDHGSEVSFFLVNNATGQGPVLHRHPYTETWIVESGDVVFVGDDQEVPGSSGDVIVVGAGTRHKFVNVGPDRLRMVCVHASPAVIQEDLESEEERVAFSRRLCEHAADRRVDS